MNELQIFSNSEFGQLRSLKINGEVHFVGKDVAEILGYSNTNDALAKHVDSEDKKEGVAFRDAIGREQKMIVINESGLYSLILSSKLPRAKEFKHWVTSEVLPSTRKTGSYSVKPKVATPTADIIIDVKETAENIQALFKVKNGIAISQAIDTVSVIRGVEIQNLKELIPPADHDTGYLNATQIGEKLGGVPARDVNRMLAEANLQYKDGENWRITQTGSEYGEEMPYTKNGHSGYQIRWSNKIIPLFKN